MFFENLYKFDQKNAVEKAPHNLKCAPWKKIKQWKKPWWSWLYNRVLTWLALYRIMQSTRAEKHASCDRYATRKVCSRISTRKVCSRISYQMSGFYQKNRIKWVGFTRRNTRHQTCSLTDKGNKPERIHSSAETAWADSFTRARADSFPCRDHHRLKWMGIKAQSSAETAWADPFWAGGAAAVKESRLCVFSTRQREQSSAETACRDPFWAGAAVRESHGSNTESTWVTSREIFVWKLRAGKPQKSATLKPTASQRGLNIRAVISP